MNNKYYFFEVAPSFDLSFINIVGAETPEWRGTGGRDACAP